MVPDLNGGVVATLLIILHALQPLDDRLDVAPDFALEGRGASVVHRGVDRVRARHNGLGAGPLCTHRRRESCWDTSMHSHEHTPRPHMSMLLLAASLQLMTERDGHLM